MLRRTFVLSGVMTGSRRSASAQSDPIGMALRKSLEQRRIPAAVAMVATQKEVVFRAAFGKRDPSGPDVDPEAIFRIASMTKPITTVAALQLVERGKLSLDEPVARHLPRLANLDVLEGFDPSGKPSLRPAKTEITLRHLLTHTSGLGYDTWDQRMYEFTQRAGETYPKPGPLMFEPGTRWQYGQGIDWAGRLVEALAGSTLEDYFQQQILQPLQMRDTSYVLPEAKFPRLITSARRNPDGTWTTPPRRFPERPTSFNGGGGLFSTAPDYIRFLQMILNGGSGPDKTRILKPATMELMARNQIGHIPAGSMRSFHPDLSSDVDVLAGQAGRWTLGFLTNLTPLPQRRSAGSLTWAGLSNTFFWVDPKRRLSAVLLMQFLPFCHADAVAVLQEFEGAIYARF